MRRIPILVLSAKGLLQRNFKLLGMNPVYYLAGVGLLGGVATSVWAITRDLTTVRGPALFVGLIGALALLGQTARDGLQLSSQRRHRLP